eukprot:CAMPEP_0182917444 /NCGR_PEP_ID=MMETSP0105_2-20130417/1530_1 /TAXON_ID=81532 ORGANISM="Acanthoeca-like sp., Strain 10tr" /NCGR_SAMPLE_ID=MMETSP0105_2 /ASSEMBLY_ACC=CAM_ASM_000205 /LENGTH=37 /DNA_ID= /DNA_START= /DNA_END= /DNA_ORIENTATION=
MSAGTHKNFGRESVGTDLEARPCMWSQVRDRGMSLRG